MLKIIFRILSLLIICATLATAWLVIEYRHFIDTPLNIGAGGMTYEIRPGMGLKEVGKELSERGVIKHWGYLAALGQWQGTAHQIKAGEYRFAAGITPQQLLDQIVAGQVLGHALTIIEGWTFRQLMTAVNRNSELTHTLAGLNDQQIMEQIGWPGQHPEGRFFPDTYHITKGLSDVVFLQRAYLAMSQHLETVWQARDSGLPLASPYEALILASIVEKETGLASERPAIAGVFTRRLQQGMRLQTDPTIIYGLGTDYDGDIKRRDLVTDTPYNTYLRVGLPPTPIALPGADAIHAALHPQPGHTLFFVARGDGGHEFSESFEAHNKAVLKYQKKGQTAGAKAKDKASKMLPATPSK
ncbi:MAG: endolytic transglycosylase MltG [Gammaproteobacteria bacterium]